MKAPRLTLILIALMAWTNSHAMILSVTNTSDSGPGSLRDALAGAADGDTIDATGVSGTILLTTGELLVSKGVTILGPGPDNLTVDGNHASRVFHIYYVINVKIFSLAISNGNAANNRGGGIYNDHADLIVSNCTVSGNSSGDGGGIYNDANGGCCGGLQVIASTLKGNLANSTGGGIYNDGANSGSAGVVINASTLSGNSAGFEGGGIYNNGVSGNAVVNIVASTLSSNSAAYYGGGVDNYGDGGSATLTVNNSTLSGNSSSFGGGIDNAAASSAVPGTAAVEIGDSILKAGASGQNLRNDFLGTVTSHGYNLSSDTAGGFLTNLTDQINKDPKVGPLQNNGGPTFTHALLTGSPAIDKGNRSVILALANDTDQRGLPRPVDDPSVANASGGDGSDIGAFEAPIPCPDLTGVWTNLVQTCKTNSAGLQCKVKGMLVVQDIGLADAPTSFVRYYLSSDATFDVGDMLLKQVATGAVKLGKPRKRTLSAKLPAGVSGSGQFILAVIDADNTVAECNENNNVIVFGPLP